MLRNSLARGAGLAMGWACLALTTLAWATDDLSFMSEDQFKEACQRFAQEDGIQPAEMNEYLSQCLMDLKMANSPGFDDESLEGTEQLAVDPTAKKTVPAAPASAKPNGKK